MAKSPSWTIEELDILINNYPTLGNSTELALILPNRTYKSINVKSSRLGLRSLNAFNRLKTTEQYSSEILSRGIIVLDTYINDATKLVHKCKRCEHEWTSKPNNILNGSGCPICNGGFGSRYAKEGIYPKIAYIYLLKICTKEEQFLKVGITSIPTNRRIWQIKYEIGNSLISCDIIKKIEGSGEDITILEGKILSNPCLVKYISKFKFNGHTELFNISEESKLVRMLNS